jgi:tRNA(adenine34) deaminase
MSQYSENYFMGVALDEARKAFEADEVPIGAVVVLEKDLDTGEKFSEPVVIASAYNIREKSKNPIGHAELLVIQKASQKLDRWRLSGCTLYVTLEPCLMCAGAIVLSRIDKIVYGTPDPKAGAVTSLYQTLADKRLNHRPEVKSGIMELECSKILKDFFARKRLKL